MYEILTLSALPIGERAYITHIHVQPDMELRFTDLGIIPGTKVTCLIQSPAGDPRGYLIRGATIALRKADADGISVLREGDPA